MEESPKRFTIDTSKIKTDPESVASKKRTIAECLLMLEDKKSFGPGDLVATIEGPYANIGLMVVEVNENGTTRVAPAPNTATIEIPTDKLYHIDDYHEAFKVALIEEQIGKSQTQH